MFSLWICIDILKCTVKVAFDVLVHFICCHMFTAEEQERFQIFKNNMKIARYIQQYDLGTATYGASPFADLTGW